MNYIVVKINRNKDILLLERCMYALQSYVYRGAQFFNSYPIHYIYIYIVDVSRPGGLWADE
jgi:hypothetical protein